MKILVDWLRKKRKEIIEVKDMFVMLFVSRVLAGRMPFEKVPAPIKEAVKREIVAQVGEEDAAEIPGLFEEKGE